MKTYSLALTSLALTLASFGCSSGDATPPANETGGMVGHDTGGRGATGGTGGSGATGTGGTTGGATGGTTGGTGTGGTATGGTGTGGSAGSGAVSGSGGAMSSMGGAGLTSGGAGSSGVDSGGRFGAGGAAGRGLGGRGGRGQGGAAQGGSGTGTGGAAACAPTATSGTWQQVSMIIANTCATDKCHPTTSGANLNLHNDDGKLYERLMGVAPNVANPKDDEAKCLNRTIVVPCEPDSSLLVAMVEAPDGPRMGCSKRMPDDCPGRNGMTPCLSDADTQTIRSWVAAGAPQ